MNDGGRIIRPRTPALPSKPQVPRVAISLPERHCGEEFSPGSARASAAGDEFENALNLCMSHMAS